MRILVCGSRGWVDREKIGDRLGDLHEATQVMHGGAVGADTLAEEVCQVLGLRTFVYLPDYGKDGRGATHARNDRMLALAHLVIAFWDGKSSGTRGVIEKAVKRGIPVEIWP